MRYAATVALGEIGPDADPAVDALVGLLHDEMPRFGFVLYMAATQTLANVGSPRAVSSLQRLKVHGNPDVRGLAAARLNEMSAGNSTTDG